LSLLRLPVPPRRQRSNYTESGDYTQSSILLIIKSGDNQHEHGIIQ
jgi:hypothetical protein